jgi:hypothetical protein
LGNILGDFFSQSHPVTLDTFVLAVFSRQQKNIENILNALRIKRGGGEEEWTACTKSFQFSEPELFANQITHMYVRMSQDFFAISSGKSSKKKIAVV